MRTIGWILAAGTLLGGCTLTDTNPDWQPQADYPAWAYDAPFYYRPSDELPVVERIDGVPIYHTCAEYFFILHPSGQQVPGVPRIAVWVSTDHGQHWSRAGYFGVEQSHFLFKADTDGEHWVRFVGPKQGKTTVPPGMPHRIYIVDRREPQVILTLTPNTWEDTEHTKPRIFKPGQNITLHWQIIDPHLKEQSIVLEMCHARFPHNKPWWKLPEKIKRSGSTVIELPPEAAQDGGVRFRLLAEDKAGNVGLALTDVVNVYTDQPRKLDSKVVPVEGRNVLKQTHGTPGPKLGWPSKGELLRGGQRRVLVWMPRGAKKYDRLELEFSENDARNWHTLNAKMKVGKRNAWTVPRINSKNCGLRIVGIKIDEETKTESRFMLVQTGRFTVTTPVPGLQRGPKELPEE